MAAEKVTLRIFDLEMDRVLPVRVDTAWTLKQITRGIKKHRADLHSGAWKLQRNGTYLPLGKSFAELLDKWEITEDTDVRLLLKRINVGEAVQIGMMRLAPGVSLEAAQGAVDALLAATKTEHAVKHAATEIGEVEAEAAEAAEPTDALEALAVAAAPPADETSFPIEDTEEPLAEILN